jgi:hypothetical protein
MSYIAKNGRLYTSGASEALTLLDDKFSVNKSYSKGDSCIYNDYLWKFTSDKPAGEWDSSVVEQCRIMDFVDDVNGRLTQVQSQIVPTASIEIGETANKAYSVGDFLVKDGILYKVTKAIAKDNVLTVGTNIELGTVTSELSEISERLSQIPISEYKIKEYTIKYNNTKTWMEYNIEEKNAFLDCSSYIVVEGSSQDNGTMPINYGERSLCYIRYYKDRADTIKMHIDYVCTAHVFIRYK